MKKSNLFRSISIITIFVLIITLFNANISNAADEGDYKVNLTDLTYTVNGNTDKLKVYSQSDFDTFLSDYNSGNLPEVYVTEFLFDGVSMVKTYDLDDFTENGNDTEVEVLEITVVNVNKTGNIEFSGEITNGMIAVDTNNRSGEINLILNNVKIDTDSKKAPAIYVYNKDITYTGCKVTIKTTSGSKNYIEGGKFKKVSLIGSDELSNYSSKYSGDNLTNYNNYTNYYGVYTTEQIKNILFAKVQADNEDLQDGDPYYFYKAAGAISSDIDLTFEGTGYLEITSKNKEGVETKGNLTFSGGTGDYVIYAEDDCLNTTSDSTSNKSARNSLTIDVNSLYAIVDSGEDSDEGDAIDSNGTLVINGGTVVAIAHPGQDAGLDSVNGTYINGGTVLATGDMYDAISNESKQNFMVLSFSNKVNADTLITLVNENDNAIMSYKTDRTYTNLIYSSADLTNGTYSLYKDGNVEGNETNGFYTEITNYTKGTRQAYSGTGMQGGMQGRMNGEMGRENMQQGQRPEGEINNQNGNTTTITKQERGNKVRNQMQNNGNMTNEITQMPNGEVPGENADDSNRPEMPNGDMPEDMQNNMAGGMPGNMPGDMNNGNSSTTSATNADFVVNGVSNQFSGIADYSAGATETNTSENTNSENSENNSNQVIDFVNKNAIPIASAVAVIILVAIFGVVVIKKEKKKDKI